MQNMRKCSICDHEERDYSPFKDSEFGPVCKDCFDRIRSLQSQGLDREEQLVVLKLGLGRDWNRAYWCHPDGHIMGIYLHEGEITFPEELYHLKYLRVLITEFIKFPNADVLNKYPFRILEIPSLKYVSMSEDVSNYLFEILFEEITHISPRQYNDVWAAQIEKLSDTLKAKRADFDEKMEKVNQYIREVLLPKDHIGSTLGHVNLDHIGKYLVPEHIKRLFDSVRNRTSLPNSEPTVTITKYVSDIAAQREQSIEFLDELLKIKKMLASLFDEFKDTKITERFNTMDRTLKKMKIQNTLQFHALNTEKDFEELLERIDKNSELFTDEDLPLWREVAEEEILSAIAFNPDLIDHLAGFIEGFLKKYMPDGAAKAMIKWGEKIVRKANWLKGLQEGLQDRFKKLQDGSKKLFKKKGK